MQHAVVTPATTVNHGTMVAVECPSPFTLVGNPTPKCINGVFTDIPSCENSDVFDISGRYLICILLMISEHRHEKTCLRGLRPGKIQTDRSSQ